MYDLEEARKALEQIKRRVAERDFPYSITISRHDVATVLKPLHMMAQSPELMWQIQQAEIIETKPVREAIPSARDRWRAKQNTGPNECYYNAIKDCRKLGTRYCEGWVVSPRVGILIHHASL